MSVLATLHIHNNQSENKKSKVDRAVSTGSHLLPTFSPTFSTQFFGFPLSLQEHLFQLSCPPA